jgi:hypothetical protein
VPSAAREISRSLAKRKPQLLTAKNRFDQKDRRRYLMSEIFPTWPNGTALTLTGRCLRPSGITIAGIASPLRVGGLAWYDRGVFAVRASVFQHELGFDEPVEWMSVREVQRLFAQQGPSLPLSDAIHTARRSTA